MDKEQGIREEDALKAESINGHAISIPAAEEEVREDDGALQEEIRQDYSSLSRAQLAEVIRDLAKEDDLRKVDVALREVKPLWDDFHERERTAALTRFLESGGTKEDFEYKPDEWDNLFDGTYKLLRDRRSKNLRDQEEQRQRNHTRKLELLEQLRALVDREDSDGSLKAFKEIQNEWKKAGSVPAAVTKEVWANYHALVDRYYDNRSILFELKELDRRKNLEAKLELCVRAERLATVEKINDAVKELNELHNEFRHLGPVPKEEQENVWQRFKKASDAIYEKRDAFVKELQVNLQKNLEVKNQLTAAIEPFAAYTSDRIKEWNQKTKEILELQKQWEASGGVPRAKSKEINKRFWTAFKAFFHNKSTFFHKLDGERQQNLALKQALLEKARSLKDSLDWEQTSQALIDLQAQWKEIGPVPEKLREKIFAEFKEACDHFFNKRRTTQDEAELEQKANLARKEAICTELEQLVASGQATQADIEKFNAAFNAVGFVPRQSMNSIRNRFSAAVEKLIRSLEGLSAEDKDKTLLQFELSSIKDSPDAERKIYQREQNLRKKIQQVENDLSTLRNNLEFFGRSKNAEKFKEEFNGKIQASSDELAQLKAQLKLLRQAY